jgi:hypothetical protein
MRIFISYRRDDTAGRAGRLFDLLVSRLGERNVFQDVAAIAPGTDFTQQVDDAIIRSDAVLVVIGPEWLTVRGTSGTRRLEEPDDFVRAEVAAALGADVPVVPVLVGGAQMPAPGDLPEELRPLVNRQAARIDDDSWRQDVDALVRRLEGEAVGGGSRRGRTWSAIAAVVAVVAVFGWLWSGRDGSGDDGNESETAGDDPPPCVQPDDSWQPIEIASGPTANGKDPANRSFTLTVDAASARDEPPDQEIVVNLRLDNDTDPEGDADETSFFIAPSDIEALYVDGVSIGAPTCFSTSPTSLAAGGTAYMLVGFEGPYEPGASLVLSTDIATLDVTVADGD